MSLLESPVVDGDLLPVFVYGTLQPDEVRWFALASRVVDHVGIPDHVRGRLWDTGYDYPALTRDGDQLAPGCVLHLIPETAEATWQLLVEIEGAVDGFYLPCVVTTESGVRALVFVYDAEPEDFFVPIRAWRHGPVS